jgi:hypothetical protein
LKPDEYLGIANNQENIDKNINSNSNSNKLYHLLTYSKKFKVGSILYSDYNSLIDFNLSK